MRATTCVLVAAVAISPPARATTPATAVAAVWADASRLPEKDRHYARWLTMTHLARQEQDEFYALICWQANRLSREPDIVRPARPVAAVIRLDLRDYCWSTEPWEALAKTEPYFLTGEIAVPKAEAPAAPAPVQRQRVSYDGGRTWVWRDVPGAARPVPKAVKAATRALNCAVPVQQWAELVSWTGSEVPVVRADWWFARVDIARDDGSGYYDVLGLGKKQDDFLKLVGADLSLARKLKKEMAAAIDISGVTLQNRGIEQWSTITGGLYRTQDYRTSTFKQNRLRLLLGETEPPAGDASEQIGFLPNELLATWLQNDKGERQDVAPPDIASDSTATSNDRQVHAGQCFRCHSQGFRTFDDWVRRVYRPPVQLTSADYEKFKRLRQLYLSDINARVAEDNARYARAVGKATGLTPQQVSALAGKWWHRQNDAALSLADVSRELGVTPERFMRALKQVKTPDPVLAVFLHEPTPILPWAFAPVVRREHFEELVGAAYKYIVEAK